MLKWLARMLDPSQHGLNTFQKANREFVAKRYDQARKLYLQHADSCPEDAAKCYAQLGEICIRTNTLHEPKPHGSGAASLVFQGDTKSAEVWYRKGLEADANNIRCLRGVTGITKRDDRIELLKRHIELMPRAQELIELGDEYRSKHKDYGTAIIWYEKAYELDEEDFIACDKLADMCRRLGRDQEANTWSERARQARPPRT